MATDTQNKHVTHWIGGKPWTGEAERRGDIYNPATGHISGTVDFASSQDVDQAVKIAKEAAKTWGRVSLSKRATVLFAFRELVKNHATELAKLITDEHGKVAIRRGRRSSTRPRGRRVRLRHPAPPQGRVLRERLHRGRSY